MVRRLLLALLVVLLGLVLVGTFDRARRSFAGRPPRPTSLDTVPDVPSPVADSGPAASDTGPPPPPGHSDSSGRTLSQPLAATPSPEVRGRETILPAPPGTPVLDRLVRLGVRRRLRGEGARHYLDSLLASSDSIIRRWSTDSGALRFAIVTGGPVGWQPRLADEVRVAIAAWESRAVGLPVIEVSDTFRAHLLVRWVDRFPGPRSGETRITWDLSGNLHKADVRLALADSAGAPLPPEALRIVALHEAGHALGLPHSAEPADVMFPSAMVAVPSDRDRFTLRLLYDVPLGSIRDSL